LNLYMDASALLPLFIEEPKTQRAQALLRGNTLVISDFAVAEFSSGVARRARLGEIDDSGASAVFAALDAWAASAAKRESLTTGDVGIAISLVRRLELGLRAPDAINIAIAQRCEAQLLTFDEKMGRSARSLGLTVVNRPCSETISERVSQYPISGAS
jgi:predicted nucleic acid-binding protein